MPLTWYNKTRIRRFQLRGWKRERAIFETGDKAKKKKTLKKLKRAELVDMIYGAAQG